VLASYGDFKLFLSQEMAEATPTDCFFRGANDPSIGLGRFIASTTVVLME